MELLLSRCSLCLRIDVSWLKSQNAAAKGRNSPFQALVGAGGAGFWAQGFGFV